MWRHVWTSPKFKKNRRKKPEQTFVVGFFPFRGKALHLTLRQWAIRRPVHRSLKRQTDFIGRPVH